MEHSNAQFAGMGTTIVPLAKCGADAQYKVASHSPVVIFTTSAT